MPAVDLAVGVCGRASSTIYAVGTMYLAAAFQLLKHRLPRQPRPEACLQSYVATRRGDAARLAHGHLPGLPRAGGEFALDLAQFNPVAVRLDLEIHASQKLDTAICQVYLVAGLVQPPRTKGIGNFSRSAPGGMKAALPAPPICSPGVIGCGWSCASSIHLRVGHWTR